MSSGPLLLPPPWRPSPGANDFEVLGVTPKTSLREVKRAYLKLARKYHPDLNPQEDTKALFQRINKAYLNIMSHRDLTALALKCPAVKAKAEYAEGLQIIKQAKLLAGIEPPAPQDLPTGEMGERMRMLFIYLTSECPDCWKREKCDHATRFDGVQDIYEELISKAQQKARETSLKSMQTLVKVLVHRFGINRPSQAKMRC